MGLLEFARGPALAFSVAVLVLGFAWRLYAIFRRPVRPEHSEPRRRDLAAGGLRAIFAKMLPPRGVKVRGAAMANAYAHHIGLALVVFGFAPHIGFIERYTGVSSPAVPDAHRYRAFEIKMKQVEAAGAQRLATSCSNCRLTFDDGQAHYKWDRKMESLLELVAEGLD